MVSNGGWTCPKCGAVWAPWFPGPCPHPTQYVNTADTTPDPYPQYVLSEEDEIRWEDDDE